MFLSGKVELIFDKLSDQGLHRFLMKLGGTYTSKTSPVLAAEVSVSMVTASMYRGLSQIFPGFPDLRSLKSSQSPVPLLSSWLNHWVQQAVGSNNSQMERWLQETSLNLEEEIRRWSYCLSSRGRSSWSERGNRYSFRRSGHCSCRWSRRSRRFWNIGRHVWTTITPKSLLQSDHWHSITHSDNVC